MPIIECNNELIARPLITSLFIEDGKEPIGTSEFRDTVDRLWDIVIQRIHANLLREDLSCAWGKNVLSTVILPSGASLIGGFRRQFPETRFAFIAKERLIADHDTPPQIFDLGQDMSGVQLAVLCDPLIATGKTMHEALTILKDYGIPSDRIVIATLFCSEEAARHLGEKYRLYLITSNGRVENNMLVPGPGHFSRRWCGGNGA